MTPLEKLGLSAFLGSTPCACYMVFWRGSDRTLWAIANSYAFSIGMVLLYFAPLLSSSGTFNERLDRATWNWIVWLSVFTELAFQIPHNAFVQQLHDARGSFFEWPFWSYGLSDDRWANYQLAKGGGLGLAPEVWLINWNDSALGVLVGAAALAWRQRRTASRTVALSLAVVFRDATLLRETIEYMWDHHRQSYPHSVGAPTCTHAACAEGAGADAAWLRPHAIACLWLVNVLWLVAPLFSTYWAFQLLLKTIATDARVSMGKAAAKAKKKLK
eukprot:g4487.t1